MKFLKKKEDIANLTYEFDVMHFLNLVKEEWGLWGTYPQGEIRLGIIQASKENLKMPETYTKAPKVLCLYGLSTKMRKNRYNDYLTYLNDPDLIHEEFLHGLRINAMIGWLWPATASLI